MLSRLFEPLQRGTERDDKSSRSVGLGLYIVEHIVRAHSGTIDVTSSPALGTTFIVSLPRNRPPPQSGSTGQHEATLMVYRDEFEN